MISIIFGIVFYKLVILSYEEPEDIYEYGFDILEHGEGGRIETEIYASFGECVSETTTRTKYGIETSSSTDHYFAVPVFDKYDQVYYMCVEVREGNYDKYNQIVDDTYAYLADETGEAEFPASTIDFEGTISELDDEIYEYVLDWFRDGAMFESEAELKERVLPLYLEPMNFSGAPTFLLAFIVFVIISIVLWIVFFVLRSKEKKENAMAQSMARMNAATLQNDMYQNDTYQNSTYQNSSYQNNTYQSDSYNAGSYSYGYSYQNGNSDDININGMRYSRQSLSRVNSYITAGDRDGALMEFQRISGLGIQEVRNVIDNWDRYYLN